MNRTILKFQNDKLHIEENAAPLIPLMPYSESKFSSGINIKLKLIFRIAARNNIVPYTFWFPVICNKFPTDPENELINLPQDKKINAVTPVLNSSPNNPRKKLGKRKNITIRGTEIQKIIFVDWWTTFFNPSKSFFPNISANLGEAILFIAINPTAANIDNLKDVK